MNELSNQLSVASKSVSELCKDCENDCSVCSRYELISSYGTYNYQEMLKEELTVIDDLDSKESKDYHSILQFCMLSNIRVFAGKQSKLFNPQVELTEQWIWFEDEQVEITDLLFRENKLIRKT